MKINEIKKKDGSTVYRTNIYLGVDVITGKKVTTKVTARTKKELKTKAQQAHFDFKANGSTRYKEVVIETYEELASYGGITTKIQLKLIQETHKNRS